MTVSVLIKVNGPYKLPVKYKQGERETELVVSGYGLNVPAEHYVAFSHGPDVMTLEIGPEERDNGPDNAGD